MMELDEPYTDNQEFFDQTDGRVRPGLVPPELNLEDTNLDLNSLSFSSLKFLTPDSCHTEDVVERGQLEVNVKKVSIARSNSAIKAGMPCYEMSSKPRGQALIIEIDKYENDVQEERIGSHHDVVNLKKLLTDLGFEVKVHRNLIKSEFDSQVWDFSKNKEHAKGHMMIMAVLSHGRDGKIFAADGRYIETESIYEKFNNQFCPLLKGKPKFFIIQACRGEDTDKGACHEFANDWEGSSISSQRKRRMHGTDTDTKNYANFGEVNKARPTWEDMIIAYSTIPGFASIREHDKGTWFIQSLVEVFSNHAHDKELIDLLRMTSERLSQFTNDLSEKQTCNIEMRHLYKRIYFNPGYYVDASSEPAKSCSPKLRRSALRRSRSNPPGSPVRVQRASLYDDDEDE